ncbi:hypothetical protein VB780_29740 [Leptolyngbya sp. CCNP1308]|nr:hypothetical protein [Leptolyngbya sp. CCNP1308]MEA5452791.1 hypothetical protein [Leptolyngbya sp. CCNP1308]
MGYSPQKPRSRATISASTSAIARKSPSHLLQQLWSQSGKGCHAR